MTLCRFRIDDSKYEQFVLYCKTMNKTVSEVLRDFVATSINGVATEEYSCGHTVATEQEVVATNRDSLIKDTSYVVATNVYPQFDPYTGERIN